MSKNIYEGIDPNVVSILKKHSVSVIQDLETLNTIFEVEKLKSNQDFKTLVERPTIIVFDEPVYNSAFMHEMLENFMCEHYLKQEHPVAIDIWYCCSIPVHSHLFTDFFKNIIGMNYKPGNPVLMSVLPEKYVDSDNKLDILFEHMKTLTQDDFIGMYKNIVLYHENYVKLLDVVKDGEDRGTAEGTQGHGK